MKLYKLLRGVASHNWVSKVHLVTESLNNTPIQKLGWLKPNDINSEESSVFVDEAKKKHRIKILKEPTFDEQQDNQRNYKGKLNISDYVYVDFDRTVFDKSFDVSVIKMATPKLLLRKKKAAFLGPKSGWVSF